MAHELHRNRRLSEVQKSDLKNIGTIADNLINPNFWQRLQRCWPYTYDDNLRVLLFTAMIGFGVLAAFLSSELYRSA
jgi:hypothetical protein